MIPMRRWSTQAKWFPFQLGDRTAWEFQLQLAMLDAGASVTLDIEVSPTAFQSDWVPLISFGPQTVSGIYTLSAVKTPTPDFTIITWMRYIRARVSTINGTAVFLCVASAPFLDKTKTSEYNLLSQEFRKWGDGQDRVLEEAEADVVNDLLWDPETGELDIDLTAEEVHRLICLSIADQAEHLMKRDILARAKDPSSMVTLREMGRMSPGFGKRLRKYRSRGSYVWMGR